MESVARGGGWGRMCGTTGQGPGNRQVNVTISAQVRFTECQNGPASARKVYPVAAIVRITSPRFTQSFRRSGTAPTVIVNNGPQSGSRLAGFAPPPLWGVCSLRSMSNQCLSTQHHRRPTPGSTNGLGIGLFRGGGVGRLPLFVAPAQWVYITGQYIGRSYRMSTAWSSQVIPESGNPVPLIHLVASTVWGW